MSFHGIPYCISNYASVVKYISGNSIIKTCISNIISVCILKVIVCAVFSFLFVFFLNQVYGKCLLTFNQIFFILTAIIRLLIHVFVQQLTCPPQWYPWEFGSSRHSRPPGHPRPSMPGGWLLTRYASSWQGKCRSQRRSGASPNTPVRKTCDTFKISVDSVFSTLWILYQCIIQYLCNKQVILFVSVFN